MVFPTLGEVKKMNLFQALTDAMDIILASDESAGMLINICLAHGIVTTVPEPNKLFVFFCCSYIW